MRPWSDPNWPARHVGENFVWGQSARRADEADLRHTGTNTISAQNPANAILSMPGATRPELDCLLPTGGSTSATDAADLEGGTGKGEGVYRKYNAPHVIGAGTALDRVTFHFDAALRKRTCRHHGSHRLAD